MADLAPLPEFILGVDLDGVVADHTLRFREIMAELRGVEPETMPLERSWDFAEWGFKPDEYAHYHRIAVMEHDMFATMPVIDGAAEALWRLSDAGVWIRIITASALRALGPRKGNCRHRHMARHAPAIPYRDLCFLGKKPQVEASAYIDDAPHNVEQLRSAGQHGDHVSNSHITATSTAYGPQTGVKLRSNRDRTRCWARRAVPCSAPRDRRRLRPPQPQPAVTNGSAGTSMWDAPVCGVPCWPCPLMSPIMTPGPVRANTFTNILMGLATATWVHRHRDVTGGTIRAAVFGVSDGLVSNVALILGVAAAASTRESVLIAGVAGLLAGSASMAAGEYVSMKAQAELVERELDIERLSIAKQPEMEQRELAAIYRQRGADAETARRMAEQVHENPEVALDVHAREELGVDPRRDRERRPLPRSARSLPSLSGALIPLFPWFFFEGNGAVIASAILGLVATACVGAVLARFTERSMIRTAGRQMSWAIAACTITWVIGSWLGTAVG